MEKSIIKGESDNLEECYKILMNSELSKIYFSNKDPRKMISRGLENEDIFVVLNDEKKCIGFILFEIDGTFGKYPYLHMIVIDKDFQGKGIGKALISYFENVIAASYDKVFLMVGDFNKRAKKLYEKLNYEVIGTFPDFYIDGINEYLMMKYNK